MEEIFKRVERFHSQFLDELEAVYKSCSGVNNIQSWYSRLDQLTAALERGDGTYRQIEDHIFELKIINYLLKSFPDCEITYEPKGINQNGKNCDLEVKFNGERYLVEIKSFHPEGKSAPIPHEHIAEHNNIVMDDERYHAYQATRGHLIDVTYHTEQKLDNFDGDFISVLAVPDGFHLNIEDLRDFVFIYRNDKHRQDDPLGPITLHNLKEPFKKSIDQFWAVPIPQDSFNLKNDKDVMVVQPLMHEDKKLEL